MNFFDEVIAISEFMQKNRPFPLFRNMKLMPNFIDEESVTKKSQEYPIDPFDILFLGRMSAAKGPYSLIKVIDYIKKKLKIDLKAYFIGDGKELLNLKRKISELGLENNILFKGFLENPYPYIKSAKALVLPSESEGVSRAVLEALFLQTPVVVADQQASIELIYPGQNGELYNKESNALVDSIIKSLSLKQKQNVFLPTKFRQKNIREILKEIIK